MLIPFAHGWDNFGAGFVVQVRAKRHGMYEELGRVDLLALIVMGA